jgi:branched-chain amino acid transport system substrate-binding protein
MRFAYREERMAFHFWRLVPIVAIAISVCISAKAETIKIGVLTDMSGPYSAVSGKGSVEAVKLAVRDWSANNPGYTIEVISGDHQNKADIASGIARRWFDVEGVNLVVDLIGSPISIAVQEVARQKDKISITVGSAATILVGKSCSPTGIQWLVNGDINARSIAVSVVKKGDSWFFITLDDAGGRGIEDGIAAAVKAAGGEVVGTTRFPLATTDFASFILQAKSSGAKVIALASAGGNTTTLIKQLNEFDIGATGARVVVPFLWITDVQAIGLEATQGMEVPVEYYWDQSDEARRFAKNFQQVTGGMPSHIHAANYTAVLHYLKAVKHVGSTDAQRVIAEMRELPIEDFMTTSGKLRLDGSVVRDRRLYQVKSPAESKGPWDLFKPIGPVINGETVLPPLSKSDCPYVRTGQ